MTDIPYVATSSLQTPCVEFQETGACSTVSNEVRDKRVLGTVLELVVGSSPVKELEDRKSAQAFSFWDPSIEISSTKLRCCPGKGE